MSYLFRFFKPFVALIVLNLILVFVQSMTDLSLPRMMSDIINQGVVKGDNNVIWSTGGWMLLLAGIGSIAALGATFLASRIATGIGRDLRQSLFDRVSQASVTDFDRFGASTIITRCTNDVVQVQSFWLMAFRMIVMAPMMAIGGIIMAWNTDQGLTWILLAVIPLLAVLMLWAARKGTPLFGKIQGKLDYLNQIVREGLTGIRVIRAFDKEKHEASRFNTANLELTGISLQAQRLMGLMMPAVMLIMNLTTIVIIWFGAQQVNNGQTQIGSMMAFMQYGMQILFSIVMVSMLLVMYPRASISAKRISEVLEGIDESHFENAKTIVDVDLPTAKGDLEFRNVSFTYPGAEKPAIENISFHCRAASRTAIIGGTGAGKTTLLNLALGFYPLDSGQILLDGLDIRQYPTTELRKRLSWVPQQAFLFSDTLRGNIRFGQADALDSTIEMALARAQASDIVQEKPEGLGTKIDQGGANLSGGQKQRLAIARALVRPAAAYLLDDCFSALDYRTDARLRSELRQSLVQASLLIVAQRVSTVKDADLIIVMDDGHIVASGTHTELQNSSSVYQEIIASQQNPAEAEHV